MAKDDFVWYSAHEWFWGNSRAGIGITVFPYQLAVGLSLRWWERGPALRLYLGPLKAWAYVHILPRMEAEP